MIGYHVTRRSLLPVIRREGLIPQIPEDMPDEEEAVFLFQSIEDAEDAMMNWFSERIEEWEERTGKVFGEVVLEVDLSGLECRPTTAYEWACKELIDPSRILAVRDI